MGSSSRKVGERGQVTIPKEIRDKEKIRPGDRIEFEENEKGELIIEKEKDSKEELKKAYKQMSSEKQREISEEMLQASETNSI
ncbi:MAG: AbrB/MazE/SpoVT family DNA-binding domain-containing protein [Candidatus Nanohaloarchaea archaeon]